MLDFYQVSYTTQEHISVRTFMTSRYIGDLTHVEHLLVVEGDPDKITAFVESAQRNGSPLSLEALVPPPAELAEIDALMVAHFHLIFGEQSEARILYDEIDEPWPLPEVDEASAALRELLRTDPTLMKNARLVQKNVQKFGALDVSAWKRARWGAVPDLRNVQLDRVNDDRVHYRFESPDSRHMALQEIAAKHPGLSIGAIVTNFGARKQQWFYRFFGTQDLRAVEQRFPANEDVIELFIDNPPELFAYAG
jgi:hypothetical protein